MVPDRRLSPPQLLEKKKRVQLKDMGEDLECLCQIMRTVGPRLDHEKAKVPFSPSSVHLYHRSDLKNEEMGWLPASVVVMSYQVLTQRFADRSAHLSSPSPSLPPSPVFNGSVLCPYAILNEQQGVARQDPLPAARHGGTARKQLGPPQGFHRQRTKDDQPDPPGRSEGAWVGVGPAAGGVAHISAALLPPGLGCFHPSTHVSGDEDGLLPGEPLHPQPSEAGQRDAGRIGRHVWTDARSAPPTPVMSRLVLCLRQTSVYLFLFCSSGSGIGTGPGVIQDRYSPTMGRHRTNPLFNGHGGHIAPPPQSQFDMGPKSFVKSNQVGVARSRAPSFQQAQGLTSVCATGAEPAFPQPEPHGPAAGPVQGHASTFQQERPDQRRRGNADGSTPPLAHPSALAR